MNSQVEIWKSHPDIEGIEVSSFGRVRSVKGHYYTISTRSDGYLQVQLHMNGKHINKLVHRLVAQTFIPNLNNFPEVNHKNCVRDDNYVTNLEWCSRKYNRQYREKHGVSQTESTGHPLFAISLDTLEVSHFSAQKEAERELGISQSDINNVIKGRQKIAYGFWFVNDDGHAVDIVKSKLHDIGKTGLKIKCRSVH